MDLLFIKDSLTILHIQGVPKKQSSALKFKFWKEYEAVELVLFLFKSVFIQLSLNMLSMKF